MESALHIVVMRIEKQMETGGYALGTFLDMDGAYNATPYLSTCREAEEHGAPRMLMCHKI